jgi:hypothetical protein
MSFALTVPTIKVHDPGRQGDYLIINESAFDPAVHRPWSEPGFEAPASVVDAPVAQTVLQVAPDNGLRGKRQRRGIGQSRLPDLG